MAFALKVGQHPTLFPLLDGLDVKLGQLVPAQAATISLNENNLTSNH
jgi:hypothetical protein